MDMDNGIIILAKELLKELKRMKSRLIKQVDSLSCYEGWNLKLGRNRTARNRYYDVVTPLSPSKSYVGGENKEVVLNIKRYRYAKEAISIIDKDIPLLETLIDQFVMPDYKTINDRLDNTYRTHLSLGTAASYMNISMPAQAVKWKEALEAEKAKYPPFKPEQLKHPAFDGTLMRSKSEVIIANILLFSGIPFVYEAPIFINGKMILPDFRILSLIDLKSESIIEHQGMIFVDEYAQKHLKSTRLYLQSDEWIPNSNLFFTYDDADETLNVRQVVSILRNYIKPSLDDSTVSSALFNS